MNGYPPQAIKLPNRALAVFGLGSDLKNSMDVSTTSGQGNNSSLTTRFSSNKSTLLESEDSAAVSVRQPSSLES